MGRGGKGVQSLIPVPCMEKKARVAHMDNHYMKMQPQALNTPEP